MTRYLVAYVSVRSRLGDRLVPVYALSAQAASEVVEAKPDALTVTAVWLPAALQPEGE